MRSSSAVMFLASAVAAQNSATVFNLFPFGTALTYVSSDASATTFTNSCPSGNAGLNDLPDFDSPGEVTPTPAPTPRPRMRRQDSSSANDLDYELCEPYTLIQGPSTYEFHLTDPTPDTWTVDMSCNWQGAISVADLTCTVAQSGSVVESRLSGTTTSILSKGEAASLEAFQTVSVVSAPNASATPSGSAAQTSGSGTAIAAPTASGSSTASGSPATQSTGLAAAGPLPTGAVAFFGGAAGILAAALAL